MAYKLLLLGNDANTIDLLFDKMDGAFACVTTSHRTVDLKWHNDVFKPDAVVYCMLSEDEKYFNSIAAFSKSALSGKHFVIVGSEDECREFQTVTGHGADAQIVDPESAHDLKNKILDVIEGRYKEEPAASAGGAESVKSWDDILGQLEGEATTARKHILVIDDDPLMLKVIKDYLHDDYEVATAKSGAVAYKFLEKRHTDLILLDYEMPEEKGPDVLTKIRKISGKERVPVIFLTGVKDKERLMEIVKVKPQGFLNKPIERGAMYEMIKKVLK